ncbi:MAG: proprotein convertase P-domain-containing protein, partial [Lentisphaeria bacterium]|nr:proprotein convertase P-domain-containing protein [Lentisphaeria bacterium]
MDGQMHAREVMTAEVMMDAIDRLTSRYATDAQVRRWVDEMEIWIVPVVNPDGATYVHNTQPMWRKNRSHNCDPFPGVDLNRNFAWNYRQCSGSDDTCSSDVYHGPSAASEIETQTMQALMQELRPMYYINYHTYGEYILWSSGCGAVDEDDLLRSVGEELNDLVRNDDGLTGQWTIGPSGAGLYTAPGGSDDFAYGASGAVAFTFELNAGSFQPDYDTWRDLTVTRQRAAWSHLLDRTLDGPSLRGHTFDAQSGAPVVANYRFVDHPFSSGQWALETDVHGRFGRANLPQRSERLVFTAPGYLPELREVQVNDGPVDLEVPMQAGINQAPTAQITAPTLVNEGDTVSLDGSNSTDPNGNTIFYAWRQTSGPEVYFDNPLGAQLQFIAPAVDADTDLIFELIVDDGELSSNPQTTTVRVRDMWDDLEILNATDTPQNIPDNDPAGIISVIHVTTDRRVLRARVHVDITHTYIGELTVSLKSPAQTLVLLQDMSGGSANNIHTEYLVPQVAGEMSAGDWTLQIVDHGVSDLGRLDGWQLTLDLEGGSDCQTAADCDLFSVEEATCTDGRCEIVSCLAPWLDCNLSTHDGCEADPRTDLGHCGGCDQACSYAHGIGLCQDSTCLLVDCLGDYEDCNEDESDGCEV